MHFFYLDETGCTGADLISPEQPIFVLGGISVSDDRWRCIAFHGQSGARMTGVGRALSRRH